MCVCVCACVYTLLSCSHNFTMFTCTLKDTTWHNRDSTENRDFCVKENKAYHVARGNDCVIIEDGGNWLRQVEKVWFVGQSLTSLNFLDFTSVPLLALRRVSHVVSFESTRS